ncbi:hypothetical protein FRB99_003171, partial [Tulasnella sp. 403]
MPLLDFRSVLMPSTSFTWSTFAALLIRSIKYVGLAAWLFAFFWFFRLFVYWPWRSKLTKLPGPPAVGRVFGSHLPELSNPNQSPRRHEELREKYGLNLRIHGMGYFDERYVTFDPVAINYILGRAADVFPKPWQSRRFIAQLVGEGLFVAEGERHRKQRKIISPAFSAQALRALQGVFFSKAFELRDVVAGEIKAKGDEKLPAGGAVMDMHNWLWRSTFDIIGLAGFAYSFNATRDETNEVYRAYRDMFQAGASSGFTLRALVE